MREYDSALQTFGRLQLMIELAFWTAHRLGRAAAPAARSTNSSAEMLQPRLRDYLQRTGIKWTHSSRQPTY